MPVPSIITKTRGDFNRVTEFLHSTVNEIKSGENYLTQLGETAVAQLYVATPKRTGKTASSWGYELEQADGVNKLTLINTNVIKGYANIALLIVKGHGTRTRGYVPPNDFISPIVNRIGQDLASIAERSLKK